MAMVYADAAALLTLCVPGRRSTLMEMLWRRADLVVTSRVAEVQVPGALGQAHRGDMLTTAEVVQARKTWDRLFPGLYVMENTAEQGRSAAQLVSHHDVRADDAWHLAAALTLAPGEVIVAAGDERLAAAARREGLRVLAW